MFICHCGTETTFLLVNGYGEVWCKSCEKEQKEKETNRKAEDSNSKARSRPQGFINIQKKS